MFLVHCESGFIDVLAKNDVSLVLLAIVALNCFLSIAKIVIEFWQFD
jgi:hypothetical protein